MKAFDLLTVLYQWMNDHEYRYKTQYMKTTRSRVGSLSVAVTKSSLQKDIRIGSPDVFSAKIEEEEDFDTNLLFYFENQHYAGECHSKFPVLNFLTNCRAQHFSRKRQTA